jgi:tetratricopeptide (TPR) repeat protein
MPNPAAESEFKLASDLMQQRDASSALVHYRTALDLDAQDSRYWIGFGMCLFELRHWEQAVLALARGLELAPSYGEADARLVLGDALAKAGRRSDAVEQWRIVAQMKPTYPSHEAPIKEARARLAPSKQ